MNSGSQLLLTSENFSLREVLFSENVDDQYLINRIAEFINLINKDSREREYYGTLGFNQVVSALESVLEVDLSNWGVDNPEQVFEVIKQFVEALNEHVWEESRLDFQMDNAFFVKLVAHCLYLPESYGRDWGIIDEDSSSRIETSLELYEQALKEFINAISKNKASQILKENLKVGEIAARLNDNVLTRNNLSDFLNQYSEEPWLILEQELNALNFDDSSEYELRGFTVNKQFRSFVFGVVGAQVNKFVNDNLAQKSLEVVEYLTAAFGNGYKVEEVKGRDAALMLTDDEYLTSSEKARYLSQVLPLHPNYANEKESEGRLVLVDDSEVVPAIYRAILKTEGRYTGPEYISSSWVEGHRYMERPRLVPLVEGSYRTSHTYDQLYGYEYDPKGFYVMTKRDFIHTWTAREIEELNRRINYCLTNNEPFVIYVPTCPCDQHALKDNATIEFTGGEIVPGVSWTAHNTIDALSVLVPELEKIGVQVEVVMATGDMEHSSGNTRGMDYEAFMRVLDQNHDHLACLASIRLNGHAESRFYEEQSDALLRGREVDLGNDQTRVIIDGIINLAEKNGINWFELKENLKLEVEEFFNTAKNQQRINHVLASRTRYYALRMRDAGIDVNEANLVNELKTDILDYVAFHTLAQLLYGAERMMVLAGDSYLVESLASEITGNLLMAVYGNYDGAKPIEAEDKSVEG